MNRRVLHKIFRRFAREMQNRINRRYNSFTTFSAFRLLDSHSKELIKRIVSIAEKEPNKKIVIIFPLRGQYAEYLFFRGIASYLRAKYGFKLYLRPLLTFSRPELLTEREKKELKERQKRQLGPYRDFDEIHVFDFVDTGSTIKQIEEALSRKVQVINAPTNYIGGNLNVLKYYRSKYSYYMPVLRSQEPSKKRLPLYFDEKHRKDLQIMRRILRDYGYRYMKYRIYEI